MKPHLMVKVFVILSALALGGGYVAYRQSQSQIKEPPLDTTGLETEVGQIEPAVPVLMPSSKRIEMPIFSPRSVKEGFPPLLPSSKVGRVLSGKDVEINRNNINEALDQSDPGQ